jgi:ureidoglycolate hydrolase
MKHLGEFVEPSKFHESKVTYVNPVDKRTGREMIVPRKETVGKFDVWNDNGTCHAENHAVNSGLYNVAKLVDNSYYFREVNYHPECSQIVCPDEKNPFILILGVSHDDLGAYMFDGTMGFAIAPGIWHQPPITTLGKRTTFNNKQAESHICVLYDSVQEDKRWMKF